MALSFLLGGCSDTPDETQDEHADWTAEQFYKEARNELNEKRFEKAAKLYEKLEARYPFGKYATQAQLDVAYAYYKNDEPDSAIAAADRFIKLNPAHPHVDYAYYVKGLVNYNRGIGFIDRFIPTDSSQRDAGPTLDSYKDFEELVRRFPNSRYAEDSRKRLTALRNNLAMHEIHVADFYMRREAYLAAARRAGERDIPSHYHPLPRTDGILVPARFAEKRKPARKRRTHCWNGLPRPRQSRNRRFRQ